MTEHALIKSSMWLYKVVHNSDIEPGIAAWSHLQTLMTKISDSNIGYVISSQNPF